MSIVRALYGLKSSGTAWRAKLADILDNMGYVPYESDPDIWMERAVKPSGGEYWTYMLIYVDDCLHINHNPSIDLEALSGFYRLKDGAGALERYLDTNVDQIQLKDGSTAWSMTCVDYLKGAIKNANNSLGEDTAALKMLGDGHRPFLSSYQPEIDVSPLSNQSLIQRYQHLVGILRWAIELRRIDIYTEVSCLL